MKKIKICLTVDGNIYKKFLDYCKRNGMKVSSKVELYMKSKLKEGD